MQRTYYTDSETIHDYLAIGCDDGRAVTDTLLDQAGAEIAHRSRYTWNEREALAFCATLSDDERRLADSYAATNGTTDTMINSIGYHACRVAFYVIWRAAVLDLRSGLDDLSHVQ